MIENMHRQYMNKIKKAIPAFIMLLMLLVLVAANALVSNGTLTGTEASASGGASQIQRLRRERAEYEKQKEEINERINAIEFERMAELDKKKVLDERIMLTGMEISNLKEIINQYNLLANEKEYEIIISQNREDEQLRRYKARVRDMEENGVISYLEVIFDSNDFTDLLSRLDFFYDIMTADQSNYLALQQARIETEKAKEELDELKAELDSEREKIEFLEDELQAQLDEAFALLVTMESNLESERRLLEVVTEEEDRVQREIRAAEAALRRQREAERQAQLAAQPQAQSSSGDQSTGSQSSGGGAAQVTGTGELMWPVSGNIISSYGMRSGRMHQGLDIGAPHGTPVVAADSGTVTTSAYGSGYGNYIVVSHGNGMTTLYAHLSSRSVAVGATVSKGQQIGLVGSTGNASCSHLHLEVSVDGARVNPVTKL